MKASDFNYPSNEHPLRAWLVSEQEMIEETKICRIFSHNEQVVIGFWDANRCQWDERGYNTKITIEAILLHPTGVWGKKVCESCNGSGHGNLPDRGTNEDLERAICSTCHGAGYLKAVIYERDVCLMRWDGGIALGIVLWLDERAAWGIYVKEGKSGVNELDEAVYRALADYSDEAYGIDHERIIVGTVFAPDKIQWPDDASPKHRAWVVGQHKELMESLG